ncbi:Protein ABHD17C [Pitangus sulphuratus]|nr:Protein ABHD17C [Pitangus sulphuratus]
MPEQGPRMNGFSLGELCWLFCCPPCPSRIAAKLAFLPPEPTYTVLQPEQQQEAGAAAGAGTPTGSGTCSLHLSERADWQYSQRELDAVEVFFSRTARDNRLGCMFVRCAPTGRYTLLFSHGNAVDLGQMCSFYIGLGSRINCNVFSYDYSGYGVSTGKPSEKNLYADIDAAWQALRTRFCVDQETRGSFTGVIQEASPTLNCMKCMRSLAFLALGGEVSPFETELMVAMLWMFDLCMLLVAVRFVQIGLDRV